MYGKQKSRDFPEFFTMEIVRSRVKAVDRRHQQQHYFKQNHSTINLKTPRTKGEAQEKRGINIMEEKSIMNVVRTLEDHEEFQCGSQIWSVS